MKNRLIKNIVDIGFDAEEGHIPSALSILDILEVVYGKILNLDLQQSSINIKFKDKKKNYKIYN